MAKDIRPEFDFPRHGGTVRGAWEFFDAETVVDADIFVAAPAPAAVKRWNGTAYVTAAVKRWNGTSWV